MTRKKIDETEILQLELRKCFNYFIKESNNNKNSKGYGLIRDKSHYDKNIASIASVGFGLASLIVGVKHKWITLKQAYNKANGTLDTFIIM